MTALLLNRLIRQRPPSTRLNGYKILFATDRNIRRDAAEALAGWMRKGGVLVRTRGALVADERDKPLVEASLLENGDKAVIALSNWSTNAHPRVSVTLEKAPAGEIRSASGTTVTTSRKGDRLEASLEIGWGDFLVLE